MIIILCQHSTGFSEGYVAPRLQSQSSKEALIVHTSKQHSPTKTSSSSSRLRTVRVVRPMRYSLLCKECFCSFFCFQVVLKKRAAGDFGLSLRRSATIEIVNNKEVKKTIYFAEPGLYFQIEFNMTFET